MITVQQAKELCIEAHKDQWRKPKPLPNNEIYDLTDYPEFSAKGFFITPKGNMLTYNSILGWTTQEPYHIHPLAVADMMTTDEEKIVAYLHDVIEDTSINLIEYNLSKNIEETLLFLAKAKHEAYIHYIENITKNKLAIKVKIADITHNLSDNPSEKQIKKYTQAMKILLATI